MTTTESQQAKAPEVEATPGSAPQAQSSGLTRSARSPGDQHAGRNTSPRSARGPRAV